MSPDDHVTQITLHILNYKLIQYCQCIAMSYWEWPFQFLIRVQSEYIRDCINSSQRFVNGTVKIMIFKGSCRVVARSSETSLYNAQVWIWMHNSRKMWPIIFRLRPWMNLMATIQQMLRVLSKLMLWDWSSMPIENKLFLAFNFEFYLNLSVFIIFEIVFLLCIGEISSFSFLIFPSGSINERKLFSLLKILTVAVLAHFPSVVSSHSELIKSGFFS